MAARYKKRKDGRYLVQILAGYKPDGKPKYKSIYAYTTPELEKKVAQFRDEMEKGIHIDDKNMTVEKWANEWLKTYKTSVEYNTRRMYENVIRVHIEPNIGHYKLKDLKSHHVQFLLNQLIEDGKDQTAEKVHLTLKQIFDQAVKNEFVYKNIMLNVEYKRKSRPPKRALTDGEMNIILKADLPKKEKVFVVLLLNTGLRKGEALALTRNDIDLKARTITVSKSLLFKKNEVEIKMPKSKAGNRIIPITNELFDCLSDYIKTLDGMCIFPMRGNKLITKSAFEHMWARILGALNVAAGGTNGKLEVKKIAKDITPHIFRHSYATLLYRAGVDIKTAQYLLGHSSLQMTMDIYTHIDEDKKQIEINKFNQFMTNKCQSDISQLEIK